MASSLKGALFAFFLLLLWTITGVLGFMFIEGWNFIDSCYMTVLTIFDSGLSRSTASKY